MTCNYTYKEKLMCRQRWPSLKKSNVLLQAKE